MTRDKDPDFLLQTVREELSYLASVIQNRACASRLLGLEKLALDLEHYADTCTMLEERIQESQTLRTDRLLEDAKKSTVSLFEGVVMPLLRGEVSINHHD